MPIRKLPLLLINQIAAGEVIERPASVVKELVENSLDAGATRIDVAVEEGGRTLIRVSDDGGGIPADELPLAVAPHATSKLAKPEDLAAIGTMGFRGEALASMASVSRLRIVSRARRDDGTPHESGAAIEVAGDQISAVEPAATSPGSVVEIRDLFFNTPARRKFLRGAPTEFGHIAEILTRIAMSHPATGFSLTHNGRSVMEAPSNQSRRDRCVAMLGKELDEALLEFEMAEQPRLDRPLDADDPPHKPARVWGLAGLPSIARATAKFQYLCINGRPVRDRNLTHALREAYRGLVPPDKQPVAVVFLELDPTTIDVNVHPAKAEVRFRDSSGPHSLVMTAIRRRLLAADLVPSATVGAPSVTEPWSLETPANAATPKFDFGSPTSASTPPSATSPLTVGGGGTTSTIAETGGSRVAISSDAFVDYFRRMDPRQKGFVYQQVRAALAEDPAAPQPAEPPVPSGGDVAPLVPPILRSQGVLQVHQSYLVTQDREGLLIVDQHALHERVMFEELRNRIGGRNLESQRLLMPTVFGASPRRQSLLESLAPLLARIGVEAEPFGKDAVAVHAFPSFLFDRQVEPAEFMNELLDRAEEGEFVSGSSSDTEAALHEVLDMMACKAAVKAGDAMSPEELAALLAKRDEVERASNCPHGRPTAIRLSLSELAKQFKRT